MFMTINRATIAISTIDGWNGISFGRRRWWWWLTANVDIDNVIGKLDIAIASNHIIIATVPVTIAGIIHCASVGVSVGGGGFGGWARGGGREWGCGWLLCKVNKGCFAT